MGRRKIEIQPITHERNRSVTFLKRKNGLFKKAYELGVLCSVDVAVIIFEERPGHHMKLYQYGSMDIHDIVQRHLRHDGEKDTRGPADFSGNASSKLNDDDEDEDDGDDDDGHGGHRDKKRSRDGRLKGDVGSLGYGGHHSHMHGGHGGISMPQAPSLMHSSPVSNLRSRGNTGGLDLSLGGHPSSHGGHGGHLDTLGMSMMNKRPGSNARMHPSGNPHSRSPSNSDLAPGGYGGYSSGSPFGSGGRGGGGGGGYSGSGANSHGGSGGSGNYPPLFGPGPGSATSPSSGFIPLHAGGSNRGSMSGSSGAPFSSGGGYSGSHGGPHSSHGNNHGGHGRGQAADLFGAFLDADEQSRQGHGGGGPQHGGGGGGGGGGSGAFGFDWPSHGPSGGSSGSGVSNPSASSSTTDGPNSSGAHNWLDFLSGAANSSSGSGPPPPSASAGGPSLGSGIGGLGPVPPATTGGGSPGAGVSWERGGLNNDFKFDSNTNSHSLRGASGGMLASPPHSANDDGEEGGRRMGLGLEMS